MRILQGGRDGYTMEEVLHRRRQPIYREEQQVVRLDG